MSSSSSTSKAATVSEWYTVRREWSMDRRAYLIVAKPDHYRLVKPLTPPPKTDIFGTGAAAVQQKQQQQQHERREDAGIDGMASGGSANGGDASIRHHRHTSATLSVKVEAREGRVLSSTASNRAQQGSPSPRPFSAPVEGLGKRERVSWSSMPQASRTLRIKCRPCSGRGERRYDAPWRRHHVR